MAQQYFSAFRQPNTTRDGKRFSEQTINAVWEKATVITGVDSQFVRRDFCGKGISRSDYGKTTEWGWEIDHIKPISKGGTDDIWNLQPLYWENNRHKSDNYPNWSCKVK